MLFLVKTKAEKKGADYFQSEEEYKEVDLPVNEKGRDYEDNYAWYEDYDLTADEGTDYADDSGGDENCKTIDGPGVGKPCIFPFKFQGKEYNTCTKDGGADVHEWWCATVVDDKGEHISGQWGKCSKGCQGVDYEDFGNQECDTEEPGKKCFIPFSYKGFSVYGCITTDGEKPWCIIKDPDAEKGFKKANCSQSCPRDDFLSSVKLSPEEIIETLKTTPKVLSKIEQGEKCHTALPSYKDMQKVGKKIPNMEKVFFYNQIFMVSKGPQYLMS